MKSQLLALLFLLAVPVRPVTAAPPVAQASAPPMARILWLEARDGAPKAGDLPLVEPIAPADARMKDFTRWIDTEAARFARRLVYQAWQRFGRDPVFKEPVLAVLIRKEGNHAATGLAIRRPGGPETHPGLPYLVLDSGPEALGDTLLHETGHLLQTLAMGGRRQSAGWSAFAHTTFAVSDPITALSEGFAIHFETLWGHFGSDPVKRAYYLRLSPSFAPGRGRKAEYFSPVDDLMNFAQVWARYQAVRDGLVAFEGHLYPGNYARTQMDPSRDRARLKSANAMLASEGVAASVLFWTAADLAAEAGARPGGGLDQPDLVTAEMTLLAAFAALPASDAASFRPDLLDLVAALGRVSAHAGDAGRARLVDITRGVTAEPAVRDRWRTLYEKALMLDLVDAKALVSQMDAERGRIVVEAARDPTTLRAGVGPVIPVRLAGVVVQLKALGETMPVEFDLNAISAPEYSLLPSLDASARERIEHERGRAPFASIADFTSRTGVALERVGLTAVARDGR